LQRTVQHSRNKSLILLLDNTLANNLVAAAAVGDFSSRDYFKLK